MVRVVIGTEEAGEFRIFRGVTQRSWRPFKAIEVDAKGRPTLVPFTQDEIAEAADLAVPEDLEPKDPTPTPVIFTPEPTPGPQPPDAPQARTTRGYWLVALALVLVVVIARKLGRRGGRTS